MVKGQCEILATLTSDQEEADTRLLLYAKHAAQDHKRIVIQSPDTDVAVLCATHFSSLDCQQLCFRTGVKDKLRYIPMHSVAAELGPQVCDALPAMHAMTGCDSNSSISGISKKKAFKTLCESDLHQINMSQLGKSTEFTINIISGCELFVCNLYTKNDSAGKRVNDARNWLFCQKWQNNMGLPPTSNPAFEASQLSGQHLEKGIRCHSRLAKT